jgi:hypothetical protein
MNFMLRPGGRPPNSTVTAQSTGVGEVDGDLVLRRRIGGVKRGESVDVATTLMRGHWSSRKDCVS